MKPGAVIVDVAVDQGGCIETTHETTHADPVYERARRAALRRRQHARRGAVHVDLRADRTRRCRTRSSSRCTASPTRPRPTRRCAHGVNTVGGLGHPPDRGRGARPPARPRSRPRSPRRTWCTEVRGAVGPTGGIGRPHRRSAVRADTILMAEVTGTRRLRERSENAAGSDDDQRSVRRTVAVRRTAGGASLSCERLEDLFAVDLDLAGSLDADAHLLAPHLEHGHHDVRPDHDALVRSPCEHEHPGTPSVERRSACRSA